MKVQEGSMSALAENNERSRVNVRQDSEDILHVPSE